MTTKRAQTLQSMLVLRIKDVFSATSHFQRTCQGHIDEMNRVIYSTKEFQRLPNYRRTYLRGVADSLWDMLYRYELEWLKIGTDGRQFRNGDDSWLQESDEYKLHLGDNSVHVWSKALANDTVKPW